MREYSGRALRDRLGNVLYVRASLEDAPSELAGVADALTVVLPWGGLLAAVARPEPSALATIRGLCRRDAAVDIVLAVDPERDRAEIRRLGLPSPDDGFAGRLAPDYEAAGFRLMTVRPLRREQLACWPSTWSRRLAYAHPRSVVHVAARAV
jgi:hypothetical protein